MAFDREIKVELQKICKWDSKWDMFHSKLLNCRTVVNFCCFVIWMGSMLVQWKLWPIHPEHAPTAPQTVSKLRGCCFIVQKFKKETYQLWWCDMFLAHACAYIHIEIERETHAYTYLSICNMWSNAIDHWAVALGCASCSLNTGHLVYRVYPADM